MQISGDSNLLIETSIRGQLSLSLIDLQDTSSGMTTRRSVTPAASAEIETSSERAPLLQSPSRGSRSRRSQGSASETLILPKNVVRGLLGLLVLFTFILLGAIIVQEIKDRRDPRWGKGRNYRPYLARGRHGAVAAESERCSQIGVDGECLFQLVSRSIAHADHWWMQY